MKTGVKEREKRWKEERRTQRAHILIRLGISSESMEMAFSLRTVLSRSSAVLFRGLDWPALTTFRHRDWNAGMKREATK